MIDVDTNLTLRDLAALWVERQRPTRPTVKNMRKVLNSLGDFLGHEATVNDLNASTINGYIEARKSMVAFATLSNNLAMVRILWRLGAEMGVAVYSYHLAIAKLEPYVAPQSLPQVRSTRPRPYPLAIPPTTTPQTAEEVFSALLRVRSLRPQTVDAYGLVVTAISRWAGDDAERRVFSVVVCNRFLREEQLAGVAPRVLSGYRRVLREMLTFMGDKKRLRVHKLPPVYRTWDDGDISALIAAIPKVVLPNSDSVTAAQRRAFWRTFIERMWETGLPAGELLFGNGKNSPAGPDKPMPKTPLGEECLRLEFAKIVKAAGLTGTFLTLRQSAKARLASIASIEHPPRRWASVLRGAVRRLTGRAAR